jgi:hypothetical protein
MSPSASTLPDQVRREVHRILDAEARRLLAEQLDRDSAATCGIRATKAGERLSRPRIRRV